MIRTVARKHGPLVWQVLYRPEPGERRARTFTTPETAEAFDRIASARWPLDPLIAAYGHNPDHPDDVDSWADAYNVAPHELTTARGWGLTDTQADRLATRARLHPMHVWGWAWHEPALTHPHRNRHQQAGATTTRRRNS